MKNGFHKGMLRAALTISVCSAALSAAAIAEPAVPPATGVTASVKKVSASNQTKPAVTETEPAAAQPGDSAGEEAQSANSDQPPDAEPTPQAEGEPEADKPAETANADGGVATQDDGEQGADQTTKPGSTEADAEMSETGETQEAASAGDNGEDVADGAPEDTDQDADETQAGDAGLPTQYATAINAFGGDLFNRLIKRKPKENVLFSPYNIAEALGLLAQGADGKTKSAFEEGLGLQGQNLTLAEAAAASKALRDHLTAAGTVTLSSANGIWAANNFELKPDFVTTQADLFDSKIVSANFSNPNTLDEINGWVSQQTQGKIPTLLTELSAETRIALISALYFKGQWAVAFDPANTKEASFHIGKDETVQTQMMNQVALHNYTENETFQAVAIPFKGNQYELVVILPRDGKAQATRKELSKTLRGEATLDGFQTTDLDFAMPRLKLEWSGDLLDTLKKTKLKAAFKGSANYDALSSEQVHIDQVAHKVIFEVDEEGAEAAAATAVIATRSSSVRQLTEMTVDRPFYLLLRERATQTSLFAGFVKDPSQQ